MLVSNDTYQILGQIGQGGTGIIYKAYHRHLQKYVCLKQIPINFGNVHALRRETDILKNLHHTYLPQIYDFFVSDNEVFTVMDYIEGADLERYPCGISNISEQFILKWLRQMAEVLCYLESMTPPVIHSDIKPGNIIITPDNDICLIDFNISITNAAAGRVSGFSVNYASPEQYMLALYMEQGMTVDYILDSRTDIYSTGATFYYMMTGVKPDVRQEVSRISDYRGIGYSPGLCAIIDRCMERDREKRYTTAKDFLRAVNSVRKQDYRYRRYVAGMAASFLVSAGIVSAGVLSLYHGVSLRTSENYAADLSALVTLSENEDEEEISEKAMEILNNSGYQPILEEAPDDRAKIFRILGDTAYGENDYDGAAVYYKDALDRAREAREDLQDYYRDYAVSLALADRTGEAAAVLEEASGKGISNQALEAVYGAIAFREGDYRSCISHMMEALEGETDPETRSRYLLVMADAAGGLGDQTLAISSLEEALRVRESTTTKRRLAAAYMALAGEIVFKDQKSEYGSKALALYQTLVSASDPSLDDRINYAIVLRFIGDYQTAIRVLEECRSGNGKDYRISMYLAFCYDEEGDREAAERCCRNALVQYDQLGDTQKQEADQEALSRLRELQWKYGY